MKVHWTTYDVQDNSIYYLQNEYKDVRKAQNSLNKIKNEVPKQNKRENSFKKNLSLLCPSLCALIRF